MHQKRKKKLILQGKKHKGYGKISKNSRNS